MAMGLYTNVSQKNDKDLPMKKSPTTQSEGMITQIQKSQQGRPSSENPKEGLALLIGKNSQELENEMGKPERIDQTIYGYEWYIYKQDYTHYFQVGVANNQVVTVYAIGDDLDVAPFEIGQPLEEIFNTQYIDTNIDINLEGNSYRFKLNDTDINLRPLIKLGDIYAQLYFDKVTGTLSSVRFLDAPTLVKLKPYELVYRGKLIEPPKPNAVLWEQTEKGTEKEILDITNALRLRNDLKPLKWDNMLALAAHEHSKDMLESHDFSHTSKKYGSLADRLDSAKITYHSAGENIAANYLDGPAVVEGWLNSESHRTQILNKNYSSLGVGVYQDYYTQDFIQK